MTDTADTRCTVVVFARAPEPGKVKTRLISELGKSGAAALHRRLVAHSLTAATQAGIGPVQLWCAPDTRDPFFGHCGHDFGVSLHSQGDGDLGVRMQRAFEAVLVRSPRAILVGSDIPELSAQYLRAAGAELERFDAVIGPAEDGGYVLIGLSRCDAGLFRGVPWGGSAVLEQTRLRLAALSLRASELPPLWDLDRPEDLDRLPAHALAGSAPGRELA
jgi:rSAM/selenodomain-associated transferase 1